MERYLCCSYLWVQLFWKDWYVFQSSLMYSRDGWDFYVYWALAGFFVSCISRTIVEDDIYDWGEFSANFWAWNKVTKMFPIFLSSCTNTRRIMSIINNDIHLQPNKQKPVLSNILNFLIQSKTKIRGNSHIKFLFN